MSKSFTIFLGIAEVTGGLGVAFGVLTQLAAFGLILIMLSAICDSVPCQMDSSLDKILADLGVGPPLSVGSKP